MSGAGFGQLARDLARAAAGIESMRDARLKRVVLGALRTAESVAPEDTGALKRGLSVRNFGDGVMAVEATITSHDDYYAHFQEYGTSTMAPNPFMAPAVEKWGPELVKAVEGVADDVVRELS